jgi:cytoskeleton protein RodZ
MLTLPGAKPHALPPPPAANAAETPGPTADEGAVVPPAAPGAAAGAGGETLTLKFTGESWVQIADAHGRVLLDGLQSPGGTRSVSGPAPLRVVLGNATAVALQINGRPASLAGLVRRRGDARFSVDASGAVSAATPQPARGE